MYVHVNMHICIYAYVYIYIYTYIYMCVCLCVCVYGCARHEYIWRAHYVPDAIIISIACHKHCLRLASLPAVDRVNIF